MVGNWSGVTVSATESIVSHEAEKLKFVDLPGIYSLVATNDSTPDEEVMTKYLHTADPETLICLNVVDANNLNKDLYLTLQLIEAGFKVIVAVNFLHTALSNGIAISIPSLAVELGCPVIAISDNRNSGLKNIDKLLELISFNIKDYTGTSHNVVNSKLFFDVKNMLPIGLHHIWDICVSKIIPGKALRALEGDVLINKELLTLNINVNAMMREHLLTECADIDFLIASMRREKITKICSHVQKKINLHNKFFTSERLDKFLLHRFWGLPLFFMIMYLTFTTAIKVGVCLQDYLEYYLNLVLIDYASVALKYLHASDGLQKFLINGLMQGLCVTISFTPLLAVIYLLLGILEQSGYMVRASFIVDRGMRLIGLPGKAFIPMIVGFGCNVPAVMGARTIPNYYQRVLTIMMAPFMSCSARLAIYMIFVAAFFPQQGHNVIFSLYFIGIAVAVFTAWLLRKYIYFGKVDNLISELPDYKLPIWRDILVQTKRRVIRFISKAGLLIVPICIAISYLNMQVLEKIGKAITPIFYPMGITAENWPATVGLLTGFVAKETLIGTLNALYSGYASVEAELSMIAKNNMLHAFGNHHAAYSYLLFILLYFPCLSVIAAINKELNVRWAVFSVFWSTFIGYALAVTYYQLSMRNYWFLLCLLLGVGLLMLCNKLFHFDKKLQKNSFRSVPTRIILQ